MRLILDTTTLRRLSPFDLPAFQAYRNDPAIARFQSWEAMDDRKATQFLTAMAHIDPLMRPGHWTQIAVADTGTDSLLGDMGLRLAADSKEAELGITLARRAQGQGHATRAFAMACKLLFDTTPISCIRAWADTRNSASLRLMPRAGFTQTGIEQKTESVTETPFVLRRPKA